MNRFKDKVNDENADAEVTFENIQFNSYPTPIPISPKVKIIRLMNCTSLPTFESTTDITTLLIYDSELNLTNLQTWSLKELLLERVNKINSIIFNPNTSITHLVVIESHITDMSELTDWPLEFLDFQTVTFNKLKIPPINTLKEFYVSSSIIPDMSSLNNIEKCIIQGESTTPICSKLSSAVRTRIVNTNRTLVNELATQFDTEPRIIDISLNDPNFNRGLEFVIGRSNFRFSMQLIYDNKFRCGCNLLNVYSL